MHRPVTMAPPVAGALVLLLALLVLLPPQGATAQSAAESPQSRGQEQEPPQQHPFLRHQPDFSIGSNNKGGSRFPHLITGMKEEREVIVPPAPQETTVAPAPECPKNSRFSFCAIEPGCALTCEDSIASSAGAAPKLKACNKMCYQRCECLPDHLLLEGYCVPQAACDRVRAARTPGRKREAIEEALEEFDPDRDQLLPPKSDGGRSRPRPRPGTAGGGQSDVFDDVNDFLGSVTGGLWEG